MSRVYQYGLRPPTVGRELVDLQIRLAWEYRRDLTLLLVAAREVYREQERQAGLRGEQEALIVVQAAQRAAREEANLWRKEHRTRVVPDEMRSSVERAVESVQSARRALYSRRAAIKEHVKLQHAQTDAVWRLGRSMLAAAHVARGLRHGAYTAVNESVEQADAMDLWRSWQRKPKSLKIGAWEGADAQDPRWPRWAGEGRFGEQLQGGLSIEDLYGAGTRVRLVQAAEEARLLEDRDPHRGDREYPQYNELWVRVGTDASPKRGPVWAVFPIKLPP